LPGHGLPEREAGKTLANRVPAMLSAHYCPYRFSRAWIRIARTYAKGPIDLSAKIDVLIARIEQLEMTVTELVAKRHADEYMINLAFGAIESADEDLHEACLSHLERFADGYAAHSLQMTKEENPDMTAEEQAACEIEFEITQSTLLDYLESQRSDDPDRPIFMVIEGGKKD
jgi:hypothetical protein